MKKPVLSIDKTGHQNQFYYTVGQPLTQKGKNIRNNYMGGEE